MKRKAKKSENKDPVYTQVICNSLEDVDRWKQSLTKSGWTNLEVTEVHKWIVRGRLKEKIKKNSK